ncbi:NT transdomain protein [Skunkpox virus]|uniref:NT transdomain protein n=1 Tax=Skunkpox virus TaxID=160796 RepID=A0A1C9KBV0_9POXV|nr:NT transdomain protein [Skunkpox virus]AOP31629.1 NT transdomain protein [Skunkpox virus]
MLKMSTTDFMRRLIKAGIFIYVLRTKYVITYLLVKNYYIKDE